MKRVFATLISAGPEVWAEPNQKFSVLLKNTKTGETSEVPFRLYAIDGENPEEVIERISVSYKALLQA